MFCLRIQTPMTRTASVLKYSGAEVWSFKDVLLHCGKCRIQDPYRYRPDVQTLILLFYSRKSETSV